MGQGRPWPSWVIILSFTVLRLATGGGLAASAGEEGAAASTIISDRVDVKRTEDRPVPNPLRHVPDEILLRLRPGVSAAAARRALESVPVASTRRLRLVEGLYHVKLAAG